jgi:hypothetical protein
VILRASKPPDPKWKLHCLGDPDFLKETEPVCYVGLQNWKRKILDYETRFSGYAPLGQRTLLRVQGTPGVIDQGHSGSALVSSDGIVGMLQRAGSGVVGGSEALSIRVVQQTIKDRGWADEFGLEFGLRPINEKASDTKRLERVVGRLERALIVSSFGRLEDSAYVRSALPENDQCLFETFFKSLVVERVSIEGIRRTTPEGDSAQCEAQVLGRLRKGSDPRVARIEIRFAKVLDTGEWVVIRTALKE